jgi:hypothetical protein
VVVVLIAGQVFGVAAAGRAGVAIWRWVSGRARTAMQSPVRLMIPNRSSRSRLRHAGSGVADAEGERCLDRPQAGSVAWRAKRCAIAMPMVPIEGVYQTSASSVSVRTAPAAASTIGSCQASTVNVTCSAVLVIVGVGSMVGAVVDMRASVVCE